jgi:murein DD-endopeptidase MepM/ murein hydrolase activator NlpD
MQSAQQGTVLQQFDRQTTRLRVQLQKVQKENQEIQQLMGVHVPASKTKPAAASKGPVNASVIQSRLLQLARASAATVTQANSMHSLALRILNMRHIAQLTRARMLAFIPSIDPVDGAPVVGCFCYRTSPDVEFHEGVDLGADYGDVVHASAAGTVAAADWDGSYGEKIVIDHGNGYQTWYAHLSRMDVHAGQHVYKGEPIALVGATGFATGPHLHYQLMLNGQPIDPAPYLNGVPANVVAALP